MPEPAVIDPSRCWVRHLQRAPAGVTAPWRDDFDNPRRALEYHSVDYDGNRAPTAMAGGRLKVNVYTATFAPKPVADGTVAIAIVQPAATSAPVGVVARRWDASNYLRLLLYTTTTSRRLELHYRRDGNYVAITIGSTVSGALPAGAYRLELTATGNTLDGRLLDATGAVALSVTGTVPSGQQDRFGAGKAGLAGAWSNDQAEALNVIDALEVTATTDDPRARDVLGVTFRPAPLEGINGRQGWQSATIERRLSDDGSFTLRLPNAPGEDGLEHRDRFALLTDPAYRMGEEWLEFYREPHDLEFVGTPAGWRLDGSELELSGPGPEGLLADQRSSEIDLWGHAPRDVFDFYSGANRPVVARDLSTLTPGSLPAGWTSSADLAQAPGGVRMTGTTSATSSLVYTLPIPRDSASWTFELTARVESAGAGAGFYVYVGGLGIRWNASGGHLDFFQGALANVPAAASKPIVGNRLAIRIVARRGWAHVFLNGALAFTRRIAQPGDLQRLGAVSVQSQITAVVETLAVHERVGLLSRSVDRGDVRTPGAPTPGGLRGDYYVEDEARQGSVTEYVAMVLMPGRRDPYASRLDPTLNFPAQSPPAWQPPGVPGGSYFSARWTGSIYLDLATSDRSLQLFIASQSAARVWIGDTLAAPLINGWAVTGADRYPVLSSLRAALGSEAGWYPIVIEYVHTTTFGGFYLADMVTGQTAAVVPATRLSPYGIVDQEVRFEDHRAMLASITEQMGYQWGSHPRSLESGEFPGRLVPRLREGRDTDVIVDRAGSTDAGSEGSASDALDALLLDAAGLAGTDGDALTFEAVNYGLAGSHLVGHQGYESLAEITEENMLRQRGRSLLALRSAPAETVGLRPQGQRELADSWPMTGAAALVRWRPGDGMRLQIPELAVDDRQPRQLTQVQVPMRPDGVAPPVVGWRQRPKGLRTILEKTLRTALTLARNPQGEVQVLPATRGSVGTGQADVYTRAVVPTGAKILSAELIVDTKGDGSGWQIEVCNVLTGIMVYAPGVYTVTRWVQNEILASGTRRIFARLANGSSTYECTLYVRALVP